jgi:DNA-binding transcriptional MerR regulator
MLSTADVLSSIEEKRTVSVKKLAKKLEIPLDNMKEILADLAEHKLVEYNEKTGRTRLPNWLSKIDEEIEGLKPATGAIILPRYQEIKIQDVTIGNFTKNDLELKLRIKAGQKEIAVCDVG